MCEDKSQLTAMFVCDADSAEMSCHVMQCDVQAVRCSMTGLEAFGYDEYTFNQLITHVLGKTCEARIDKRWVGFF